MGAAAPPAARELYSGLRFLLEERGLTVADLARQIAALGERVDPRTLQRLADLDRPLRHLDTRILDALCRTLGLEIGGILAFVPALGPGLCRLPQARQRRLDTLMDTHAKSELAPAELRELEALVAEASDLDFANTRHLVEHRVRATIRSRLHSAAD